jgi:hypothetical protein
MNWLFAGTIQLTAVDGQLLRCTNGLLIEVRGMKLETLQMPRPTPSGVLYRGSDGGRSMARRRSRLLRHSGSARPAYMKRKSEG